MQFSRDLRGAVAAGDITVSIRSWARPQVKEGGRYPVGATRIEVDSLELVPFGALTDEDIERTGERDRESVRQRAAHTGPVHDDTPVYRVEFHIVADEPEA